MANNSPYFRQPASVQSVMLRVLVALLPGIAAYVWFFGIGILIQILLASLAALAGEALMLTIRRKPLGLFLGDGSALVTAWLVALTLPPIGPWWLVVVATLFAIVIVKHLYGGLGQNPFNPAMAAFCVMIVAFPQLMSQWPAVDGFGGLQNLDLQISLIFGSPAGREIDAFTMATSLDTLRTGLHGATESSVGAIVGGAQAPVFGHFGGRNWEWIALGYLLGGLWLIQQRIITWHIPCAFIATLAAIAGLFHLISPEQHAGALFHLFSGGAMLGAFFIATDPVSAATTPRGKLIYAAGIALLTWVIRSFGAYPDGIAFATLLLNIAVPLIDMWTQPPVFGHKKR
ncbi:putative inner membrane oxidoreductase [Sterolibacterium denitrificans]|uniref:Inner membrane oxidoreductase n=2 Tax=Sterolibacterium denitrificans TaxID=157592 RepID=A0A7Z7MVZ9_9PROT|nr:RnfABCDGE type electron transport complex subunit D [Sterolibacterium denitrificans]KYC29152.1 electron transporter RnfD [Sterolibacterium denitrificans]SMB29282.1 putative inner membrane oxidoreductase [Sterolibacterium denitrificans]